MNQNKAVYLSVRISERLHAAMEEIAAEEGMTLSDLVSEPVPEWIGERYPMVPETSGNFLVGALLTPVPETRASGHRWEEIAAQVQCQYGVRFSKNQLRIFAR